MFNDRATVYVVDDDESVRDALRGVVRSVGLHVQVFASAQEFLRSDREDLPGCLVLDVRLPGLSGLDFQDELARANIRIPIVFISGFGDIPMTVRAMKAGAVEFLVKPFRDQELLDAIQSALQRDRLERSQSAEREELRRRFASLSAGEREVMALVVRGKLNKQIAEQLGRSEIAIKVRRGHVMRKMRAETVIDLARMAHSLELLDPS